MIDFHRSLGQEQCLDVSEKTTVRLTDEQAKAIMRSSVGCESTAEFQKLPSAVRDKAIQTLRGKSLSLRQISRFTGVSIMVVRRITREG